MENKGQSLDQSLHYLIFLEAPDLLLLLQKQCQNSKIKNKDLTLK